MIGLFLRTGDRVIIMIPKENREWGYNPCADGTIAEVIGPTEIAYGRTDNFGKQPGVYENRSWINLRMPDGQTHAELDSRLTFVERGMEEIRKAEWIGAGRPEGAWLRELPETPFWEGDVIRVPGRPRDFATSKIDPRLNDPCAYVVTKISYDRLDGQTNVGTAWPAFQISDGMSTGWHTSVAAEDAVLVERGDVWKRAHGEPVTFRTLEEEAEFAMRTGTTVEVANPATNRYRWSLDEALAAIRDGVAHGISVGPNPLLAALGDASPRISAFRFRDEALGARVAAATLEGFPQPATA